MISRRSRPYAEALLGAAESLDAAAAVRDELEQFLAAMESVPRLGKMAVSPTVPVEVKEKVFDRVATEMELAPTTRRLLRALLVRYRLAHLGEIIEGISELLDERAGVAVARVEAAQALSAADQDRLRLVLEGKLDRKVRLDLSVSPDLMAGFVVRVGSTMYDASLRGQLDRLTAELARA